MEMGIPPTIAAETAITRQNVALSSIKASADRSQQFAEVISKTVKSSAPIDQTRGTKLNILV